MTDLKEPNPDQKQPTRSQPDPQSQIPIFHPKHPKMPPKPDSKQVIKPEPTKFTYKLQSYGSSQTGYTPYSEKVNQDAFIIKTYSVLGVPIDVFIVCDGHGKGGEKVSEYCVREIPEMIKRYEEKRRIVSEQIIEDAVEGACEVAQGLLEKSCIQIRMAGTTFVVVVVWNERIFMGTCGDSRAFLASKKGNNVGCRLTTKDHKPEDPVERKRIERHGGIVEAFKDEDGLDFGPKRVWNGEMTAPGLAMSRSIGDGYAH